MSTPSLGPRLRLSLYTRALVALGVLASFTLVVAVLLVAMGVVLAVVALFALSPIGFLADLPRLSLFTPIPSPAVALAALIGILATIVLGVILSERAHNVPGLRARRPVALANLVAMLCCLYLLVVEGSATVLAVASLVYPWVGTDGYVLLVAGTTVVATVAEVRREVRKLRERIVADSEPAADSHPDLVATARRLARLVDVRTPEVYVTSADRPESFTVGSGESAAIVVSSGLLDALSDDELEAVLAHEVSHLANGDSRVMGAALVPVLIAEDFVVDEPEQLDEFFWNAAFGLVELYGQFGVAILSRGREWSADAGAVALTGSPAALASALERLDERRARPKTDLRNWEQSQTALDILPPSDREAWTGPFPTHPPTEDRIERLRRLTASAEQD